MIFCTVNSFSCPISIVGYTACIWYHCESNVSEGSWIGRTLSQATLAGKLSFANSESLVGILPSSAVKSVNRTSSSCLHSSLARNRTSAVIRRFLLYENLVITAVQAGRACKGIMRGDHVVDKRTTHAAGWSDVVCAFKTSSAGRNVECNEDGDVPCRTALRRDDFPAPVAILE